MVVVVVVVLLLLLLLFVFFFQAEDGIRDIGVTGVQTCALPIYKRSRDNDFIHYLLYFSQLFLAPGALAQDLLWWIRMSRVSNRMFGTQSSQDRQNVLIRHRIKIWNITRDL